MTERSADRPARPRPALAWLALLAYFVFVGALVFAVRAPTGSLVEFQDQLQWLLDRSPVGHPSVSVDGAEKFANVLLFVPIGLLLRLALPRLLATLLFLLAAAFSCGIELVQYAVLPGRVPSLVDVLTNSGGAAIGLVLGADVQRLARRRAAPGAGLR